MDCEGCENRENNYELERYRLDADEIIQRIRDISTDGTTNFILKTGYDSFYDTDLISYILYSLKQLNNLSVYLSLNERGFDEYKRWKISGAEGYWLNCNLYNISDKNRFIKQSDHLKYLKRIGYQTGTGYTFNQKNYNAEIFYDFIENLNSVGADTIIFDTRSDIADTELIVKYITAAKIMLNKTKIAISGNIIKFFNGSAENLQNTLSDIIIYPVGGTNYNSPDVQDYIN